MTSTVEIEVDGQPVPARTGASVAVALLESGRVAWRTTASGRPRGLFCGIGVCHDCTATVDGVPGVRTCVTTVAPGLRVATGGAP
ncbi:(2Fe-2S)-binding protein [Phytohabitans flavus]|uniref:Proline dehydrogenase n=1 Tax=Phytohabitans flavus TaxID=1076124 RepID=A0A6F8XNG9_9ACTN|nr:(2Fe-2S)-binding protein [Phytohabitans flavus]BCB75360.1 proline dehydrogenase [Phytohabitans flavus]